MNEDWLRWVSARIEWTEVWIFVWLYVICYLWDKLLLQSSCMYLRFTLILRDNDEHSSIEKCCGFCWVGKKRKKTIQKISTQIYHLKFSDLSSTCLLNSTYHYWKQRIKNSLEWKLCCLLLVRGKKVFEKLNL